MNAAPKIHEGHNVKRIREILGIKQDALAFDLNLSQQAISQLDPAFLEEVSKALKVPVEAIKNFDEEAAVNVISNTFTSNDTSTLNAINHYCTFNPIDKIVELYDALVKSEKEKNELLQKLLDERK